MKNNDAYAESFKLRGSKYDQAMKLVPDSRQEEFIAVTEELADLDSGIVLDVPAGGEYLRDYLPNRFTYLPYERVSSFQDTPIVGTDHGLLPFPQSSDAIDAVVSVAGVHHFENKLPLFEEMARVTAPGGFLVLADVHRESPVAGFLDGYINTHNSTGHEGYYLDNKTLEELEKCGWNVISAKRKHYHWGFASLSQLTTYCHLLFDITHYDFEQTRIQLEQDLGLDVLSSSRVGLRWDLYVVTATKRETL
jgi:SAM-dependent methyltransferase